MASSPSIRAQSCSRWYFSSSGYDSVAAADVDDDLRVGSGALGGDVAEADSYVQHRGVRPRGDLSAPLDRHPLPRHGLLLHHERAELVRRAARLDLWQLLGSGELLVALTAPAQPCRDGVRVGSDVVPVEWIARFQPQCVTRAQAAWADSSLEHAVPKPLRVLGHGEELAAGFAGVAGAIDHARDTVELAFREREPARFRQPEPLDRT